MQANSKSTTRNPVSREGYEKLKTLVIARQK